MTKPEPYRPSSGTEGEIFAANWCDKCRRERAYRLDPEEADGCAILTATFVFDVDHEDYPKEWIDGPDGPCCTAYQPENDESWAHATIQDRSQMELPL